MGVNGSRPFGCCGAANSLVRLSDRCSLGLRNLNGNHVNSFGGPPGSLYQKLLASPKFVSTFADRAHRLLFNDGALTPQVNVDWVTDVVVVC